MLWSGIGWERLPREVFGCTGMTCWRRLRDWHAAGVLGDLHRVLLERLAAADALRLEPGVDRQRVVPRKRGRSSPLAKIGPNPTDRAGGRARSATSSSMPAARRSASS